MAAENPIADPAKNRVGVGGIGINGLRYINNNKRKPLRGGRLHY